MIDVKFVDLAGNVLGRRLVPEDVGIVAYDQKHFAKMANGDDDNKAFPFVFVQSERLVIGQLEKIDGGRKRKSVRVSGDGRPARTRNNDDRSGLVPRKRSDKPETDRRRDGRRK